MCMCVYVIEMYLYVRCKLYICVGVGSVYILVCARLCKHVSVCMRYNCIYV